MSSKKKSIWIAGCVFCLPLLVFLLAYLWQSQQISRPAGTNIGTLITPPLSIEPLGAMQSDKWQLWTIITNDCDNDCLAHLDVLRKVHWSLGKEANRVARRAVFLGSQPDNTALRQNFAQLQSGYIPYQAFVDWSPFPDDPHLTTFVIDPLGNAFLYYPRSQAGNPILIDMRKLLRHSSL